LLAAKDLGLLCTRCPIPGIENCLTQSDAKCIECAEGYSASPDKDVCLLDICSDQGEESTEEGSCVKAAENCTPGQSTYTSSGLDEYKIHCKLCKPGFKMFFGECQALPDPENCLEVEMSNPERLCAVCNEGYEQDSNGVCLLEPTEENNDNDDICQDTDNGAKDPYNDGCEA